MSLCSLEKSYDISKNNLHNNLPEIYPNINLGNNLPKYLLACVVVLCVESSHTNFKTCSSCNVFSKYSFVSISLAAPYNMSI